MRLFLATSLLVSPAGCAAGTESNTVDVNGRWSFVEVVADAAHGFSCADTGRYYIRQTGAGFSGAYAQRGTCQTPQGRVDNADSGSVTEGRVLGHTVRFVVAPSCEYDGDVSGTPPMRIAGRAVCVLQDATRTLNFAGTWEAVR